MSEPSTPATATGLVLARAASSASSTEMPVSIAARCCIPDFGQGAGRGVRGQRAQDVDRAANLRAIVIEHLERPLSQQESERSRSVERDTSGAERRSRIRIEHERSPSLEPMPDAVETHRPDHRQ